MPLSLGPGFRLAACCNRLVETVKTRKKRGKTGKKWARYGLKRVKESGSPGSPRGFRSLWPAAAEAVGGADGGVRPGRDAVCGGPCGRRARQLESLAGAAAGHARRLVSRRLCRHTQLVAFGFVLTPASGAGWSGVVGSASGRSSRTWAGSCAPSTSPGRRAKCSPTVSACTSLRLISPPAALFGVDVCRRWPADSLTFAA